MKNVICGRSGPLVVTGGKRPEGAQQGPPYKEKEGPRKGVFREGKSAWKGHSKLGNK